MGHLLREDELRAIGERVAAAERRTAGEIVVSLAQQSSNYARERLSFSFVLTLSAAVLVHVLIPSIPSTWVLCGQAPLVVLCFWLSDQPWLLRRLVPESVQQLAVSGRAKQLFLEHGVTETRERSGVLLYLSEAEHRIELLADRGIHERVGAEAWERTVNEVVAAIRGGRAAAGILSAVDSIGEVLARHFPPSADGVNELPDAPRRQAVTPD
jgi:putative membrane protein